MLTNEESLYFRDINRYPLLTDEQELELVRSIQANEKAAINKLITSNLRFVVSVARRYRGHGMSYLELINEGNVGLLQAAKRYDTSKNVKFISYAFWWIRQAILKALYEQTGIIKVPRNKLALLSRFKKMLYANENNYEKTIALDEFKDCEPEILELLHGVRSSSLSDPIGSGGDDDRPQTIEDTVGIQPNQEEDGERRELAKIVDHMLQSVTTREEQVLRMYYGINFAKQFTLDEIGNELELSRERVRLIRDRSLRKIFRNPDARQQLSPYINTATSGPSRPSASKLWTSKNPNSASSGASRNASASAAE